jgi:hypothetical protein
LGRPDAVPAVDDAMLAQFWQTLPGLAMLPCNDPPRVSLDETMNWVMSTRLSAFADEDALSRFVVCLEHVLRGVSGERWARHSPRSPLRGYYQPWEYLTYRLATLAVLLGGPGRLAAVTADPAQLATVTVAELDAASALCKQLERQVGLWLRPDLAGHLRAGWDAFADLRRWPAMPADYPAQLWRWNINHDPVQVSANLSYRLLLPPAPSRRQRLYFRTHVPTDEIVGAGLEAMNAWLAGIFAVDARAGVPSTTTPWRQIAVTIVDELKLPPHPPDSGPLAASAAVLPPRPAPQDGRAYTPWAAVTSRQLGRPEDRRLWLQLQVGAQLYNSGDPPHLTLAALAAAALLRHVPDLSSGYAERLRTIVHGGLS